MMHCISLGKWSKALSCCPANLAYDIMGLGSGESSFNLIQCEHFISIYVYRLQTLQQRVQKSVRKRPLEDVYSSHIAEILHSKDYNLL